jgi:hypothetical protein
MPNIPEQKKNRRLFLIWKHCDVKNKTFPRLFLKNAWKPLNFTQIIAPEKVCPSVEQNDIDTYRVLIKDGKYIGKLTCSTHGLNVFWKENHPNLRAFSTKWTFLQFYVNFITSSYRTKQFSDQTVCILGFLMYQLFECHGSDILMNSLIFGGQMTVETVPASLNFLAQG